MLTSDTTAADLLTYVVTHPEETDCRLVYADLLEERGEDARAEFIRCQMSLASWPCECDSEERVYYDECRCKEKAVLQRRERELLEAHWVGWFPLFEPNLVRRDATCGFVAPNGSQGNFTFRRGFVEQVTLTAEAFAGGPCGPVLPEPGRCSKDCPNCRGTGKTDGHAAALFAAAPVLSVTLSDRAPARERHGIHCWTDGGRLWRDDSPDVLPGDLFRLLPAAEGGWVWGTTAGERDATDDLSVACVLLGRRAAWPCESCAGTGRLNSHLTARARRPELPECPACAGTGHAVTVTPAPAATP